MGRGAYHFCARSSMPAMPLLETEHPAPKPPSPALEHTPEAMTWQQQKEFGASAKPKVSNRVKWKPLPEPAIVEPVNNSWVEQQAEFPAPVQSSRRRARGKPAISPSPLDAKRSPPAQTSPPPPLPHSNTVANSNLPTKNKSRRKNKHANSDKMTTPAAMTTTVSIPPHLRRRNAAAVLRREVAVEGADANGATAAVDAKRDSAIAASSTASDKSKIVQGAQLHSSPHQPKHLSNSPPSPPTTIQESEKVGESNCPTPAKPQQPNEVVKSDCLPPTEIPAAKQAGESDFAGWDKPKSPPPPAYKHGNVRWTPQKRVPWPKARDVNARPSESGSDGGVGFNSDSNGDVDYDVKKLLDWNGDWLPPPESWAARKGYSNRHFAESIDKWITIDERLLRPMAIEEPSFSGRQTVGGAAAEYIAGKTIAGHNEYNEVVPRRWVDPRVEDKTLREYWTDMPKNAPEALSDCDIMADPPWWDRYQDESNCYITGLAVPEARVNLSDEENPVAPHELACVEDKLNVLFQRRNAKYKKIMAKRSRPVPETKLLGPPVESRRITPMSNVYLRPVQPADVRGIAEIYNYYVDNTIFANEFDGCTEDQIRRRINDVTRAGLPYLVAVAKGNQPRDHVGYITEKIVGFINVDDHVDQSSMFRFTFDMELYIHPGFVQKRIAKCLLDKLLDLANTGYTTRGGYDYRNDSEYLKTGPRRVIKTILLNVHHESGQDLDWHNRFLNEYGFKRCGRMPGVGYKHDKIVDVSIFSYHTTEQINAAGRPTVPLERE